MYWTYFMIDWPKVSQVDSDERCLGCGGTMKRVEDVTDNKGLRYSGIVCHKCKTVIWARA